MLSLLSLIIASGTVLRADTELWEPFTYPDPRTNATQCNALEGSTLCDPDHLLPDTWRQTISENIEKQITRLQSVEIQYIEDASERCHSNTSEEVQIFVILAKRIQTASNQSITSNDLTNFGHGLREAFGLDKQECKNYVLVLGVELAKEIYVWTGSDLLVPKEQMDRSLSQYKNMFTERNYMEGLNKIVDEIGELLVDPFKDATTEAPEPSPTSEEPTSTSTTESPDLEYPVWAYITAALCIILVIALALVLFLTFFRNRQSHAIRPLNDGKPPVIEISDPSSHQRTTATPDRMDNIGRVTQLSTEMSTRVLKSSAKSYPEDNNSLASAISLPRTQSFNVSDRRDDLSFGRRHISTARSRSASSSSSKCSTASANSSQSVNTENAESIKVTIQSVNLSTDDVLTKVKSDSDLLSSPRGRENFSSF